MSKKGRLFFALGLLSLLALVGLFFALGMWMPFMWIIIATALLSFTGGFYQDRGIIKEFFTMKATKNGMNMGLMVLLAIVFLSAINFTGARHYKAFDFSSNQINSISEQSRNILNSLDSDLRVFFFYKTGVERSEENKRIFRELVKHYQDVNTKVKLDIVEINERPSLAREFEASNGAGEAFLEYKGNRNKIENYNEQDFTNAIIKATRTSKKNIYFLEGHGERSLEDEKSELSLSGFRQMLEKNSYEVKTLSLAKETQIPADTNVLVIAGPHQQVLAAEVKAIEDYLKNGGHLFLLLDEKTPMGLGGLLKSFGLELEPHYVYNVFNSPMGQVVNAQAATVAVDYSTSNAITKLFTNSQMTLFRNPHSFKLIEHESTINQEVLVKTPQSSVALADVDSTDYTGTPKSFNLGVHVRGKLAGSAKEFSAVIFSDVDFLSNILLYQNLNRDLALNTVAALAQETDLISISAKEPQATKMLLSPPEFNQFFKFTVVGLFLPLPIVFMILSIVLWYKRRHA